jgi:LacI family transcriptional regulator
LIEPGLSRAEDGYRATRAILDRHPSVTAIFASNDLTALGAVRAGYDHGRPVPDSLSVIGYDDISLAAVVLPRLTTIRQPLADVGHRAVDVLQRRIEHPTDKAERWVLPVELIVRESTTARNAIATR